jgi:hypothetical protein
MLGSYWGFAPIMILIGGLNGSGGLGPLSIPPTWPQSGPGHSWRLASSPTELNALTKASQAGPTSARASGLPITMRPTTAPIPLHTYVFVSHLACFKIPFTAVPRALGSRTSLATYMTASVPPNFESSATKRGISAAGIDRTDFSFSNASCASRARAFASAVPLRNSSLCADSSAIRSWAFEVPSLAASESATARFVSASLAETRSSENFSLRYAVLMVPQVPIATSNAPMNRTALKISNQRAAPSALRSNIRSLADLAFAASCLFFIISIFRASKRIWKRLKSLPTLPLPIPLPQYTPERTSQKTSRA